MQPWIESMYYRGIDPSGRGYAELQFYHRNHERIVEAECTAGSK
jgi:hypothetical protein